jgi:hypothetical protein
MRARLLIFAALAFAAVGTPAPASAETRRGPDGSGGAYVSPDGDPTVSARDSDANGDGSTRGGAATEDPCYWAVIVEDDSKFLVYDFDDPTKVVHSATGRWLEHRCPARGAVEVGGFPLAPEGGLVDAQQLALEAVSSVHIDSPVIHTSPPETGRLYVHVPTWLWLDEQWWRGYEATASAGRVTSTVRASPVSVRWDLGDGDSLTCRGPGLPWRPGLAEDAANCSHTYTKSSATSPGGRFHLSATVVLDITWTSNVGDGGTLEPISRSSSRSVDVGEIQAVGTGG